MMKFNLRMILAESAAAEQAHALNLDYAGFGGWCRKGDPNRTVVAKTVDGKLVRVDDGDSGVQDDLGRLDVFVFENTMAKADPSNDDKSRFVTKFNWVIQGIVKLGHDLTVLCEPESLRPVVDYMRYLGISTGVKVKTIHTTDYSQIKEYLKEKIDEGYRDIHFFDTNETNVHAAESLKATYNKIQNLSIKSHLLTKIDTPADITRDAA